MCIIVYVVKRIWSYSNVNLRAISNPCRVGWKHRRFDSIWSNRHYSFLLVLIRYTGSWFARDLKNIAPLDYAGWVENVVDSTQFDWIDTNHFPVSIRYTGSWYARDLENIASRVHAGWVENVVDSIESTQIVSPCVNLLYRKSICVRLRNQLLGSMQGGLKMLSIRLDSIKSTQIVSPCVDLLYRKSICARLRKYSAIGLCRVGWKCCRFDSIRSNRHELFPSVAICHTGSQFARDLENLASQVHSWWVENVLDLTRIDRIDTNRCPCVDSLYQKLVCARLRKYSAFALCRVGWKCWRFALKFFCDYFET